jgi:hypothetical protein
MEPSMKPTGRGWKLLGAVGVDSGQLLVTDPSYLRLWKDDSPLGHPVMIHLKTGKKYKFRFGYEHKDPDVMDIASYDSIAPGTDKTFNQLLTSKEVISVPWNNEAEYGYRGACLITGKHPYGGELGHLGVAFASGCYEVWGRLNSEKRIVEVRILME